jgi:2-oxoglutarate dehydrogenase E2 component (dihydrolipoamide succinyltransferase)
LFAEEGAVIDVGKPLFAVTPGGATAAADNAAKKEQATEKPVVAASAPPPKAPAAPPAEKPAPAAPSAAAAKKPAAPAPAVATSSAVGARSEKRVKMTRMRLRIAERLKESQNTAASLTTFNEIDMTNIIALRNKYKDAFAEKHGVKLGFMSIFVKAATAALQEIPAVNAVIDGNELVYRDYVDISVAVATPNGLVVPVLRNCETLSMAGVEKAIGVLGKKARDVKFIYFVLDFSDLSFIGANRA